MQRWLKGAWGLGLTLVSTAALAQSTTPATSGYQPGTLWEAVLSTVLFSLVGIAVALAGFKLFDVAIRFDIEREICEKNNFAAAILAASVVLGTCIIVAAVVLS